MTERKHSLWAGVAIATTVVGIGLTALSVSNAGFLANTYDASRPAQTWQVGSMEPEPQTLHPWRGPLSIAGMLMLLVGATANILLWRARSRRAAHYGAPSAHCMAGNASARVGCLCRCSSLGYPDQNETSRTNQHTVAALCCFKYHTGSCRSWCTTLRPECTPHSTTTTLDDVRLLQPGGTGRASNAGPRYGHRTQHTSIECCCRSFADRPGSPR